MQPNAGVPEYRLLQQRIGTRRVIVVTPAAYLTDNEVTLDAIAQLGPSARGVAVVHPTVTDAEIQRMAAFAASVSRNSIRRPRPRRWT